MTSSSSTDPSSVPHHPYAYATMATAAAKLSNPTNNLVVDSTSHLPEMINVSTSPTILEGTTITNGNIPGISANELINIETVN